MDGVTLNALKIIKGLNGDVMHALKFDEETFINFGEAYFSTVNRYAVKGWKKHTLMQLNLVVPVGAIRFVIYDDRDDSSTKGQYFEIILNSGNNYQRLTIGPNLWMAFEGVGEGLNMLLNIASIKHNPSEAVVDDIATSLILYPQLN